MRCPYKKRKDPAHTTRPLVKPGHLISFYAKATALHEIKVIGRAIMKSEKGQNLPEYPYGIAGVFRHNGREG
jgi:hypothetical protein